jgi:putative proteasome-type protease
LNRIVTFCVGIKVRGGVVALADTRITRGSEQVNKQKLAQFVHAGQSLFTMTSGLRSVRDKTLTYVDETLRNDVHSIDRLYQFVNLFGDQLRRVKAEDGPSLAATNHAFNLNSVIGGQLAADVEPQLFYVYPEGNWVECNIDSPYFMIGRTYYGKPILDRLLRYETPLSSAIALAFLAFDATHTSVTDVGYPIDLAVLSAGNRSPRYRRFSESDLASTSEWWTQTLTQSLAGMPMAWASDLIDELNSSDQQQAQQTQQAQQ